MRLRLPVFAIVAVAAGLLVARALWRAPALGTIEATPVETSLSVHVGDSVAFAARATGAQAYSWRLWDQEVSREHGFAFVPAPDDVGWQQVTVVVTGVRGDRRVRTWDVGVVPPVMPELTDVMPPAGPVAAVAGAEARFRLRAQVPDARAGDLVRFDWTVDERPTRREEGPATGADSELVWSTTPGTHRVAVRVSELEHLVTIASWTLEVQEPVPAPPTVVASAPAPAPASPPPPRLEPEPLPPPVRLLREPARESIAAVVGERVTLRARVQPERAAEYRWSVDGKVVQQGGSAALDVVPTEPGRRRVTLTVAADGREVGRAGWVLAVRGATPEPTEIVPPAPAPPTPPRVAAPPPPVLPAPPSHGTALAEADVRQWLEEYARAWSRKDVQALKRMGQVRSAPEIERLERYFRSVDELSVAVRVLALRVDGDRAVVEFERTDTVTDPAGQKRELRLPAFQKQIERTPDGLRFAIAGQG